MSAHLVHSAFGLMLVAVGALPCWAQDAAPRDGGFTPEEARARMVVPEGFRVELFASEPEVRQPVAATFDERGRMWVVEYLQYPAPAGVKPVTVDQYLRTEYDKLPEPPPHGPKGADRIKILEDTDGDGRADKATTFVEGLNLASGVAPGYGGVFVAHAPYLLFYPDKDRDDRPDGPPKVLLSGFGIQDAHAVINSLTWGPDGWLYGAQGSTVTARVRGHEFQQGIWRYHPPTDTFELFAEGGGNTWGVDFDRAGNLFGSSNSSFIAFHMVPGGYYWKGFAKHGPLHNPRAYGYFNALGFSGNKPGGHVTPGGILYQGGAFPKEFDGAFIGPNLLANNVYWYKLAPRGSTFSLSLGGTLLQSNDRWFRPIDALTGPDGCVYIVDWYDRRASHLDPRDNWDRSNGRIYRITYGERRKVEPLDLAQWPTGDLIQLCKHQNAWWFETALQVLFERGDRSACESLLRQLADERDTTRAMRDVWALDACGGLDASTSIKLLDHPIAPVRGWVVRRLGDRREWDSTLRAALVDLAKRETDVTVRSQLAASAQRWPSDGLADLLRALISHDEDADDPFIPLQLWWAIERHARDDPDFLEQFGVAPLSRRPMVTQHLLERLVQMAASRGDEAGFRVCESLMSAPADANSWRRWLAAFEKGIRGSDSSSVPKALGDQFAELRRVVGERDPVLTRIEVRLGRDHATERALALAGDAATPESERIALIEALGESRDAAWPVLAEGVKDSRSEAVQAALLAALQRYDDPAVADALLELHRTVAPAVRGRVLQAMCSRIPWTNRLLDAIESGTIEAQQLTTAHVLLIMQQKDTDLNARLERLWGKLPGTGTPEKDQRIAEVRGVLPEGDKGDPKRGRPVFQKHCATCHRLFGQGEAIGPDLSGAERGDLEFLLASIVDPSRVIRKEYQPVTVATKDGRVITGLIVEQNDQFLVLFDSERQRTTVPRSEVEELRESEISVMPEGLLDPLSEDEIRDLFRYLQSSGP